MARNLDIRYLIPDYDSLLSVPLLTHNLPRRKIHAFDMPSPSFTLPTFVQEREDANVVDIKEYERFRRTLATSATSPYIREPYFYSSSSTAPAATNQSHTGSGILIGMLMVYVAMRNKIHTA